MLTDPKTAVLGCGYVGLTLAVELARKGVSVLGVEPDEIRCKDLRWGANPVPDVAISDQQLVELRDHDLLSFKTTLDTPAPVYVICVPTPLRDGSPDLRHVEEAAEAIAVHLRAGDLVILESTTYPGTTEELLRPILEQGSGLVAGEHFYLAYSPERIDPGNRTFGLKNTPKVLGGLTPRCAQLAETFYRQVVDNVVVVSSPRAAELTKLLENTYREVNIALANEMAIVCRDFEIDPWEVVDAAASKPFGFTAFRPGPGVGGHCIGIDPQYLAWRVRGKTGHQVRVLETAHDINERMPGYVAQRAAEILNDRGRAMRESNVLLLGMAFKGGSGDTRESPAIKVANRLVRSGALLAYHDPHVPEVVLDGLLVDSVELSEERLAASHLVIVLTDHPDVDYGFVVRHASCVYDTRGVTRGITVPETCHVYRV